MREITLYDLARGTERVLFRNPNATGARAWSQDSQTVFIDTDSGNEYGTLAHTTHTNEDYRIYSVRCD